MLLVPLKQIKEQAGIDQPRLTYLMHRLSIKSRGSHDVITDGKRSERFVTEEEAQRIRDEHAKIPQRRIERRSQPQREVAAPTKPSDEPRVERLDQSHPFTGVPVERVSSPEVYVAGDDAADAGDDEGAVEASDECGCGCCDLAEEGDDEAAIEDDEDTLFVVIGGVTLTVSAASHATPDDVLAAKEVLTAWIGRVSLPSHRKRQEGRRAHND